MGPTITSRQAIDHVEAMIAEAIAQLPDGAQRSTYSSYDDLDCLIGGYDDGTVYVEHAYAIEGIPADAASHQAYFDTFKRYWQRRGYREIGDRGRKGREVRYEDRDRFEITLTTITHEGALVIKGRSPCIWPNGTPEPKRD